MMLRDWVYYRDQPLEVYVAWVNTFDHEFGGALELAYCDQRVLRQTGLSDAW